MRKYHISMLFWWTIVLVASLLFSFGLVLSIPQKIRVPYWIEIGVMFVTLSSLLLIFYLTQIFNEITEKEVKKRKIYEHYSKQEQLMKALEILAIEIRSNMEGHLKELNNKKNSGAPSYFIANPHSQFYISSLDSKFGNEKTAMLKQILVKMQVKVDNINRLLELTQNSIVQNREELYEALIKELNKKKGYYHDLNELLNLFHEERMKFETFLNRFR